MSVVDSYYPWSGNRPTVSFQGGSYARGNRSFSIPASAFTLDVPTGYYKASVTARLNPSTAQSTYAIAEFRLRVNVSGGLIGIGGGQRYSTLPQNYYTTNNNDTYDYSIPFATPCSISTNTNGTIRLDDLDSGTADNRGNTITVRVRDETAGTTFSLTQLSGSSMAGDFRGQMTFRPGHKYRLLVSNVHANNTLMYTFPFDNIAYKVGCAWNLLGINSQNRVQTGGSGNFSSYGNYHQGSPRSVRPGDVVQFQHEVRNSGNMTTSTFSRWRERNGWDGMSGWPQQGGTFQSRLNAQESARWPGSPTSYTIRASDVGRTLCERYVVRGQSSTNGNAYRSTASCVRVVTNWTLTGTTTMRVNGTTRTGSLASPTTVRAGDTINWTQTLRNNGPFATHRSVSVGTLVQDYNTAGNVTSSNVFNAATIASGWASGATRSWQNGTAANGYTYRIQASDVGKTLCRRLQWNPTSWNDTNPAQSFSTQRCVRVPYNFNLTPNIANPPRNLTPGEPIGPIDPRVTNEVPGGGTTITPDGVRWQLTRYELGTGVAKPANTTNGTEPCSYFSNDCEIKRQGTRSFPTGATVLGALNGEVVPLDMALGSKICYGLSVQPYSSSSNNWRHYSVCIGINKSPTIQVWGGDLRVGGTIDASYFTGQKDAGQATFGSWVEYGALSRGANEGLASGSALAEGTTKSEQDRNELTFANRPSGTYGRYDFTVPYTMADQFNMPGTVYTSATFNLAGKNGMYRPSTDMTISGTVERGRAVIVYAPTRTVTITDDTIYDGSSYTSRAEIPQLVIVARNIRIQQNVETVNAWLLASGYIDTCSDVGTPGVLPVSGVLSSQVCDKRLTVNGPVATDKLILKRTGGAAAGSEGDSAEVFNLRADAYLWRYQNAASGGQVRVVSVKELPPRF